MKFSNSLNVLLLGSGGREHAFARKIAESPSVAKLFIAPGNAGTAQCGTNVDINPNNFGSVKQFVLSNNINLVVVGPEEPLVRGIYDFFCEDSQISNIPVIGPSLEGARLEGSKDFAKAFMARHGVPTARYQSFNKNKLPEAEAFIDSLAAPYVLKADGLAAGKGVVILDDAAAAKAELAEMFSGKFGQAGNTVVIEEFLSGIECSVFVATDGKNYKILPVAKDYKRIGEGDTGPNTGGMGAVSPVPFADEAFMKKVEERIVRPTVEGLQQDGIAYKGFLFIGLMNVAGDPYVIRIQRPHGRPRNRSGTAPDHFRPDRDVRGNRLRAARPLRARSLPADGRYGSLPSRAATPATTPKEWKSAAWTPRRKASYSTPAPQPKGTRPTPRAAAYWRSPRWAARSPKRCTPPTTPSGESPTKARISGATSGRT